MPFSVITYTNDLDGAYIYAAIKGRKTNDVLLPISLVGDASRVCGDYYYTRAIVEEHMRPIPIHDKITNFGLLLPCIRGTIVTHNWLNVDTKKFLRIPLMHNFRY